MIFGRKKKHEQVFGLSKAEMEPFQKGAVDPGPPPEEWIELETELTRHIERIASTPEAIVILEEPNLGHYVQWIHQEGYVYSEASATLPEEKYQLLLPLGWKPPFAVEQKHVPNWRQGWKPPFQAGTLARIAIHTLDTAYGVKPPDVRINQVE